MIDLRGKHEKLTSGDKKSPRFRVLGLGRAGISILDRLVLTGHEHLDLVAVDTDEQTLLSTVMQRRLLLGEKIAGGLGCWGDASRGYEIALSEEKSLRLLLEGCDYLLIAVGLGGGTGGGILPKILELAQAERVQSVVFATLPYECEGEQRLVLAHEQLIEARNHADCVLTTSHERLTPFFTKEAAHRKGYEWMHEMESKALHSILMLLEQPGLFPLSFADLRSLYGRLQGGETSENCLLGYSEGEINLENEELLDDLLEGPLLAGEDVWREMDRALLSISGGKEISVLEIQEVMRQIQNRFVCPLPIAVSAHFEGPQDGKIRLTLMLAKTVESAEPKKRKSTRRQTPALSETVKPTITSESDPDFEPVIIVEMPERFDREELQPDYLEAVEAAGEGVGIDARSDMESDLGNDMESEFEESIPETIEGVFTSEKVVARIESPLVVVASENHSAGSEPEFAFDLPSSPSEGSGKGRKSKSKKVKQEELPLESPNRGRFEKASETIWKGENLDQPTFKRRALYIRL